MAELTAGMSSSDLSEIAHLWEFHARPAQLAPEGDWDVWLLMAGRGFGKTRAGAEWVRSRVESGAAHRIALIGATAADVRDVMVEGESGILAVSPPWFRPIYEPSKRRLRWPNGAVATTYSAEEPDRLRGPQHDLMWADELGAWKYQQTWHMAMLGLRAGGRPQAMVTTTPKPVKLLFDLVASKRCVVTTGTTYDNEVNLAPSFLDEIISQYEGTSLGRQELHAELLRELPGALWKRDKIAELRVGTVPVPLVRIVVAIDPAVTSGERSDETGIVVAGIGSDGKGYVLADLSCRKSPDGWARAAVKAYHLWGADRVVAETNNGGDLVKAVIKTIDPTVSYKKVHASRGKRARAEPVAALYEQGRVYHVGAFDALEDQMCSFVPDSDFSPDRMDALVWAFTELILNRIERAKVRAYSG